MNVMGVGDDGGQKRRLAQSANFGAEIIRDHLLGAAAVQSMTAETCVDSIFDATDVIEGSFRCKGMLLLCGNGGSAADCQHMAAELMSRLSPDCVRPPLPAIALTTDTSFITAYANDFGFEGVFARQIEALGS